MQQAPVDPETRARGAAAEAWEHLKELITLDDEDEWDAWLASPDGDPNTSC